MKARNYLSILYLRLVLIRILVKLILKLARNDSAYVWPTDIILITVAEKRARLLSGQSSAIIREDVYKLDDF